MHRSGRVLLGQQRSEIAALAGEAGVLDEEERVAVRPQPERLSLGRGGRRIRHRRDDLAGLLGGEAGQLEPQRVLAGEHVRDLRELPGGRRLVAPRHDDHQPTGLDRLREQPQHPQGGRVRPVQVVEEDEQVPLRCLLSDGLRDRLPRAEPGRVVALLLPGVRRQVVSQGLEHARPGVERRSTVVLRAATAHDHDALGLGSHRELGAQPALPDAGLPGDHREHGMVRGLFQEAGECGQLVVAADQGPAEMTCGR